MISFLDDSLINGVDSIFQITQGQVDDILHDIGHEFNPQHVRLSFKLLDLSQLYLFVVLLKVDDRQLFVEQEDQHVLFVVDIVMYYAVLDKRREMQEHCIGNLQLWGQSGEQSNAKLLDYSQNYIQ